MTETETELIEAEMSLPQIPDRVSTETSSGGSTVESVNSQLVVDNSVPNVSERNEKISEQDRLSQKT